jgi:hypothetical protein
VTWHGVDIESSAVSRNHGSDHDQREETSNSSSHQ